MNQKKRNGMTAIHISNGSCAGFESRNPVLTKRDFVERYQSGAGEFGNRAPTWNTYEEFKASGYKGLVHLRNRIAGGPTWYNIPADEVWFKFCEVCTVMSGRDIYFSGMAPHDRNLLQGEVCQSTEHLSLTYSTVPNLPMRDALTRKLQTAEGIRAVLLLRTNLCPNSYEWLQQLLDLYPDHVIEFSAFSCEWGTIPGFNTVFWEVRYGY